MQTRGVLTTFLAGWVLAAAASAALGDAMVFLAVAILLLLVLAGPVLSGAVAAAWAPRWPLPARLPMAACMGFWVHFVVLYVVGAGAWWPLGSAWEPFRLTWAHVWYGLCGAAAAAAAASVLLEPFVAGRRPLRSNAVRASPPP